MCTRNTLWPMPRPRAHRVQLAAALAIGALAAAATGLAIGRTAAGLVVGLMVGIVTGVAILVVLRRATPTARTQRPRTRIDPFTLSEPWRRHVSAAQSATRRFRATVRAARRGPLHDRLQQLSAQLDHGLEECWRIAQRGDEIDAALARLRSSETRRRLAELEQRAPAQLSPDEAATLESLRAQVAAADRLRATADDAAARLRATQARLEQLVATAAEVVAATHDASSLDTGVAEIVTELEALRLAVEETRRPRSANEP